MIYSKTCEYAVRSLAFVAERPRDRVVTVGEVARETGVPRAYVAKIFQCLVKQHVLASKRGPAGGFRLKIAPEKLTLLKVLRALDDIERSPFSNCIMGLQTCNDVHPCPLHFTWMDAKEKMLKTLSKATVADTRGLGDHYGKGRPRRGTLSRGMKGVFCPGGPAA